MDYEAKVQNLYEKLLRKGDNCIDVGAHAGRHMFPMAQCVAPSGQVYGFEPIPNLFEALNAEIARRGVGSQCHLAPYAASTEDGEAEFVVALDSPGYSGLKERTYDTPTRLERIRVQTRRLDGLHGDLAQLRFIKIDVEGGEWGVIRGATNLITRLRPVVAFEFGANSYEKYGVDPGEVFDFFVSRDYGIRDILGNALPERQRFIDESRLQKVWDYAAIPREIDLTGW